MSSESESRDDRYRPVAVTSNIVLVTYGYRDTTAPHAAILQRPRYFRLVRALFRAPPPAGRSRRFAERRPNGPKRLTVEPERLGLAQTVVCRGLRVSGERSGGRKPRAGAGAARRRGASPQPARPPARQPLSSLARARAPAPGAPPTRPAVSYFAPRFHSRLKGLSHLRIFIRQYILATPA